MTGTLHFLFIFFFSLFVFHASYAQKIQARVLDSKTHQAIEYVNIGIVNKANGTTSNTEGKYEITLDGTYNNDSLKFSCIGYAPYSIKVSDYKKRTNKDIELKVKDIQLNVVNVKPRTFVRKTLGYSIKSKFVQISGSDVDLGNEIGVMLKVKKLAKLETLNINLAALSYDTVFFRVNLYRAKGDLQFENILAKPIYMKFAKSEIKETLSFDLRPYHLYIDGTSLITVEFVRNLGKGYVNFCGGIGRLYFRKASQAKWETIPGAIGMNVVAEVEK